MCIEGGWTTADLEGMSLVLFASYDVGSEHPLATIDADTISCGTITTAMYNIDMNLRDCPACQAFGRFTESCPMDEV